MRTLFVIALLLGLFFHQNLTQSKTVSNDLQNRPKILFYNLEDTIHGGTVEILNEVFKKAQNENFEAVLIQLDTPGGLLDSTEDIVKLFLNTNIPVIVYVAPSGARAGSAGTFITIAAHIAAMAPGTYIGAAHPVMLFGGNDKENVDEVMKKKIESAASTYIQTIAETRNRNEIWAKKAVLESEALTQKEALKNNVIDFVSVSKEELLTKLDGRVIKLPEKEIKLQTKNYILITYEPDTQLKILSAIADPTIMYLLVLGIIAGIYLEVSHPGAIIPGIIAGVSLIVLLFATRTLPINALGILLIIAALAFLITDIFVPSYGLLSLGGVVCFFLGSIFFFDPSKTDIFVPLSIIIGSSAALGAIAIFIGITLIRTFKRKQAAGKEMLIGLLASVEEDILPGKQGKIFINGEYWNAVSDEVIPKGEIAEIIHTQGLTVSVKKVNH